MKENTPLTTRMQGYENAPKVQFPSDSIIVARIDGRGFSKFTKNFDKPFDRWFTTKMIEVTKALVEETCATVGYTQSDEISLIWHTDNPNGQVFFNGKLQKLVSICASIATAYFNNPGCDDQPLAFFDCRVFTVPSKDEGVNYLFYRQRDAIRNSISMAAHTEFGHKKLMNKSTNEQIEMLKEAGIDWFDYPTPNKIGTFVKRELFDMKVPATGETCKRSRIIEVPLDDVIPFETMKEIVFGGNDA